MNHAPLRCFAGTLAHLVDALIGTPHRAFTGDRTRLVATPGTRTQATALGGLLALLTLSACTALPPKSDCPSATDMRADLLHGQWTAQVAGEAPWTLTLGPHPEHAGSLRGSLTQGAQRHAVVADLDDGEFTLEESHDGQRIAATWLGSLPTAGCGRQIQGQRVLPDHSSRPFQIIRTPTHTLSRTP